jgi:uncharacterized PurR-regulated membrane protein YhhQ (DUF165 family)
MDRKSNTDPWLLPSHQLDYPTRDIVAPGALHARRERTFLVLATIVTTTFAIASMFGTRLVLDVGDVFERVSGRTPNAPLHIPFGALLLPLGFAAIAATSELFGSSRTRTLVVAACIVQFAVSAISAWAAQLGDGASGDRIGSVAIAATGCVALVAYAATFDWLRRAWHGRRLWFRCWLCAVVAWPIGWAAYAALRTALGGDTRANVAVAAGATLYGVACAVAGAMFVAWLARVLAAFLRVGRGVHIAVRALDAPAPRTRPESSAPPPIGVSARRARRRAMREQTAAEQQFFLEGDSLADSSPKL